jgi:lipoate-protein ligase A
MGEMWRVIDTGLRSAAQNIALDRALLEARHAEEIPSTLRFCRYAPSVLLASRQSAAQEFDLDHCRAADIAVQRRVTGGDAMYCAGAHLGWALYVHRRELGNCGTRSIAQRLCHAAAAAVGALGVDARFRAQHDIEVDGCKIGSAGGAFDGDAFLYQGVLLVDLDAGALLRTMRTPAGEPSNAALAMARERVGSLASVLGARPDAGALRRNLIAAFESEFAVEFHDGDLSLTEHARYRSALAEIDTPGWVDLMRMPRADWVTCAAAGTTAGGGLNAHVVYDRSAQRIKQVWFAYDWTVAPRRVITDLEAALRDTAVARLEHSVRTFFAGRAVAVQALAPGDFVAVVRRALNLPVVAQNS